MSVCAGSSSDAPRSFNSQKIASPVTSPVTSSRPVIIAVSVPVIMSLFTIPVSEGSPSVHVAISLLACMGSVPHANKLPNSMGYMVLRIKNVVNPNATKAIMKNNTLTPLVFVGI